MGLQVDGLLSTQQWDYNSHSHGIEWFSQLQRWEFTEPTLMGFSGLGMGSEIPAVG